MGRMRRMASTRTPKDEAKEPIVITKEHIDGLYSLLHDEVSHLMHTQPDIHLFALIMVMLNVLGEIRQELGKKDPEVTWPVATLTAVFPVDIDWETEMPRAVTFTEDDVREGITGREDRLLEKLLEGLAAALSLEVFIQMTACSVWIIDAEGEHASCLDRELQAKIVAEINKLSTRKRREAYEELFRTKCFGTTSCRGGEVKSLVAGCDVVRFFNPETKQEEEAESISRWMSLPAKFDDGEEFDINFALLVEPMRINKVERDANQRVTMAIWVVGDSSRQEDGERQLIDVEEWRPEKQAELLDALERCLDDVAARLWKVVVHVVMETNAADAAKVQARAKRIAKSQQDAMADEGLDTRVRVRTRSGSVGRIKSSENREKSGRARRHPLEEVLLVDENSILQSHRALMAMFRSPTFSISSKEIQRLKLSKSTISSVRIRSVRKSIERDFPKIRGWISHEVDDATDGGRLYLREERRKTN